MSKKDSPKTCREAAVCFRKMADDSYEETEYRCHQARAEVLDAFEDLPVPQSLLDGWFWPS